MDQMKAFLFATSAFAACFAAGVAAAGPFGGAVVDGSATISATGSTTTVTQSSDRAIIEWQSFNVGAGERVDFTLPTRSSISLNRVLGAGPSLIDGRILANGRVFIINRDGVIFGAGSRIDASGLLATSANIANSNFMAGNFTFDQPGAANASIISLGTIDVREAGMVAFVAPNVRHSGVIAAQVGKVALGSGDAFTLDFFGDNLIAFAAVSADGTKTGRIHVDGEINAGSGVIALTATSARDFIETIINVEGDLVARSASRAGGKIILAGSDRTDIAVSGTVDASGSPGGSIAVTGGEIAVSVMARLTTAAQTGLADGGDILVHSVRRTEFAGLASSEPGAASGAGGDITITSGGVVLFSGTARAGAPPRNGVVTINGLDDDDGDVDGGGGSAQPIIAPSPEIRNQTGDRIAEIAGAPPEGYGALGQPATANASGAVVLFEDSIAFDIDGDADAAADASEARLICMLGVADGACGQR